MSRGVICCENYVGGGARSMNLRRSGGGEELGLALAYLPRVVTFKSSSTLPESHNSPAIRSHTTDLPLSFDKYTPS